MSVKKIPPIRGKDNKSGFVSLFFQRLLEMKIVLDSDTVSEFIQDSFSKKDNASSGDGEKEVI